MQSHEKDTQSASYKRRLALLGRDPGPAVEELATLGIEATPSTLERAATKPMAKEAGLPVWLFAATPVVGKPAELPEALAFKLERALEDAASAGTLDSDPALINPLQGPMSARSAAAVAAVFDSRTAKPAHDVLGIVAERIGEAEFGRVVQAFVLGAILPPDELKRSGGDVDSGLQPEPEWLQALAQSERRPLLAWLNEAPLDDVAPPEVTRPIVAARPLPNLQELANLPGDPRPRLAVVIAGLAKVAPSKEADEPHPLLGLFNGLGDLGLVQLLTPVDGRNGPELASLVSVRRELRGGKLATVGDLEHLPGFPSVLKALVGELVEEGDGCRIRIEGPSRLDIREKGRFEGHLEAGEPGGSWSWEILPGDAARTSTYVGATGRGLPLLDYLPNQLGFAAIVLRYRAPSGRTCVAIHEIEHTMPECLIYFVRPRTRLPVGSPAQLIVRSLPPGPVRFEVTDPNGVVRQFRPALSPSAELHQLDLDVGPAAGDFTVRAVHLDGGCVATQEIRAVDPSEGQYAPGPAVQCQVAIVEGTPSLVVGHPVTFRAEGRPHPQRGSYEWIVVPPDAADVSPPHGSTVQITPRKAEPFMLQVKYTVGSCTAFSEVYGVEAKADEDDDGPHDVPGPSIFGEEPGDPDVELVRKIDPDRKEPAVPLVQHVPNCFLSIPGDGGVQLRKGDDFRIVAVQVFQGRWETQNAPHASGPAPTHVSDIQPSVRVDLRSEGHLWDTLVLIQGMAIDVDDRRTFAFAPGEFWDSAFKKWYPNGVGGENVQVEGLGVHHLRVRPRNALLHEGRFHAFVSVELTDAAERAVADAGNRYEEALRDGVPDRIAARSSDLAAAWRDALWGARVRSTHNRHVPHSTIISDTCRFRVRAFPEGPGGSLNGQVESEPSAARDIHLQRDAANRLLSNAPHPDFFVTLDVYPRSAPKTFRADGLLHGEPDKPSRGYYPPAGQTDAEITYGVGLSGPHCLKLEAGEKIRLDARGTPTSWKHIVGQYSWSIVSKPEGATVTFDPPGPSPKPFTLVQVDRSGHYVAQVDYVIDDPANQCNQTYAIVDFHVVIDRAIGMRLLRVGDYPAELAVHKSRPFYRRRTLEEQEGADLLVHPQGAADLGHRLRMYLEAPKELRLNEGLTLRVYTKQDRSEWKDYQGPPHVRVGMAGANTAMLHVESLEPIYAAHIMRIRYRGLLELPGHAVEVALTVIPGEDCKQPTDEEVHLDPEITIIPAETPSPPPDAAMTLTRVNLLLFEHDLGDARAGNAVISPLVANDRVEVDIANGNVHFEMPMFEWEGRGMSLRCSLHYNSFHAAQMEAVERMGMLNDVSLDEREAEYARTGPGDGFAYTFGTYVIDYVLSEAGANIRKRLELVDGKGNHIQFEATEPLGKTYEPAGRGTMIEGDAIRGASLVLREIVDKDGALTGYELEDVYRMLWRFDPQGRLERIATLQARSSNGALAPIRLEYLPGRITVTDTAGRCFTIWLDMQWRVVRMNTDFGQLWSFDANMASPRLLGWVQGPEGQWFEFDYAPFHFIKKLTNGLKHSTEIQHVQKGDAWGRVHEVKRSGLEWSARYKPVTASATSKAETTDARGTLHRYEWDRDSLALLGEQARRERQGNSFGVTDAGWIRLDEFEYAPEGARGSGKLLLGHIDVFGHDRRTEWTHAPGGYGFLVSERKLGGTTLVKFTYDDATRMEKERTDKDGQKTTFRYDRYGNLIGRRKPPLAGQSPQQAPSGTWEYRADGSLVRRTDIGGRTTVYGYDEGGRDPHGVGLATSQTLGGDTWKFAYEPSGLPAYVYEPLHGGRTDYEYDQLDRIRKVSAPEATVVDGPDERRAVSKRTITEYVYDASGNLLQTKRPLAASTSASYDEHDRMVAETNSDGTIHREYDGLGAVTSETDRRGNRMQFELDYLGRKFRTTHAARSGGTLVEDFHYPDDGSGNTFRYRRGPRAPGDVGITYPRRTKDMAFDVYDKVLRSRQMTEGSSLDRSPVVEWTYQRDVLGNLTALRVEVDGSERYRESYGLDQWYRIQSVTLGSGGAGGATTDYELGPLDEILAVTLPEHGAGSRARWRFGYDVHLRPTTVHDPDGRLVRKNVYDNATAAQPATVRVEGVARDLMMTDPYANHSGPATTTVLKTTTYDARGLPMNEKLLGLPEISLFHDENGCLRVHKQKYARASYERDGQDRPTVAVISDRAKTDVTRQSFDANGNLTFLQGKDYGTEYGYDSGDRLISETRVQAGLRTVVRRIFYDALDRPVSIVLEGAKGIRYSYRERSSCIKYAAYALGEESAQATVTYHWTGAVKSFERKVGPETVVSVTTEPPDSAGRVTRTTTRSAGISGTVEVSYWPAGTRKSLSVTSAGRTLSQHEYRYWPDGQLKEMPSAHGGAYEFRYHPAGHLASWKTPRGDQFAIRRNACATLSHIQATRAGLPPPVESNVTAYPLGTDDVGLQHVSVLRYPHASGEFPDTGTTTYSSLAKYDHGLPHEVRYQRSGLGETIERNITNTFSRGSLSRSVERHVFPGDRSRSFTVTRDFLEGADRRFSSSRVNTSEAEVVSRYHTNETTVRDALGRTTALSSVSLIDPGVFHFFGDPRSWHRSRYVFTRDELGRVDSSYLRMESTRYEDPHFRKGTVLPTRPDIWFYRNHLGVMVGRKAVVQTRDDKNRDLRLEDCRLFLHDGSEVIAEVGKSGIIRYYELGPGEGFRLSVMHTRTDSSGEVVDEYLYSAAMVSVGLIGPDGKVKVRFGTLGLPGPGDDRLERGTTDDDEEKHVLPDASPLYVGGAEPSLGGMPPYVRPDAPTVVGSGLGGTPDEDAVGILKPHAALVEQAFNAGIEMVPGSELPKAPPHQRSAWDVFVGILDWTLRMNPYFGQAYTLAKTTIDVVRTGDEIEINKYFAEMLWNQLAARYDIPIDPIEPMFMAVSSEDYAWYDYVMAAFGVRDPIMMLNGYDPATGAMYTWNERLDGAIALAGYGFQTSPLVELGDGCFPGDTAVWTPTGRRRIEEIWPGDAVLCFEHGRVGEGTVADVHVHRTRCIELETRLGMLQVSPTQPMLRGDGVFVRAEDMATGDVLVDVNGRSGDVLAVRPAATAGLVYHLSVPGAETYVVASGGWIAHNKPSRTSTKTRKPRKREKASIQTANHRVSRLSLVRPAFSSAIRKLFKLKRGQDRRHIVPASFMRHMIEEAISGSDFATAERILTRAGHPPSRYAREPRTGRKRSPEERILKASEAWLRRLNSNPENLWVGDAKENQAFGRLIGKYGRSVSSYEPWLIDTEPGSEIEKIFNSNP